MRALCLRYLRNDLRHHRGVTITLLAVLVLSAFLMASGTLVMERLSGSVGRLFEIARPPHLLQMHRGGYDPGALRAFAAEHPEIEDWLIEEMEGFDGQAIRWERPGSGERGDFSASMIDNLFVTRNDRFDLLLDRQDVAVRPADGEVYVPVAYEREFGLRVGDRLTVGLVGSGIEVRIAGFVRDAQMASSMSSATRFVVSQHDFDALGDAGGTPEIIVEYRLRDRSGIEGLQRAYEADPALPKNGQAVTEVMIRLVNMVSDGLVAAAFVFASLLLIAIALLNVRFVMRGTVEDEIHEIGAMRAIGLPHRTIMRLYLLRYGAMAFVACAVGGGLAGLTLGSLTSGIRENFAEAPVTAMTFLAPILALALLFLLTLGICARALRAVKRMDVVDALVRGTADPRRRAGRRVRRQRSVRRSALAPSHHTAINRRLALIDLRAERRQWALIPAVFLLTAVLLTLPINLLSTFESPHFVNNMGAPESDLRADVQFVPGAEGTVDEVRRKLQRSMESDHRITSVKAYAAVLAETPVEGEWESLRIEVGDYKDTSLAFLDGAAPRDGEIALSMLNSEKLGKRLGDWIALRREGVERWVRVSGVYQDVTSGGFTAKMQGEVSSGADRWVLFADVVDGTDPAEIAGQLDAAFPAASVIPMREYVRQTLSYVTDALRTASAVTLVLGLGSVTLVATLFLRLRIEKDRRKMGVLSAIGFSTTEIVRQLRMKMLIAVVSGIVLGVVLAATLGERLVGALISMTGLGVERLSFAPWPWLVYALIPVLLLTAGMAGALLLTRGLHGTDRSGWLR